MSHLNEPASKKQKTSRGDDTTEPFSDFPSDILRHVLSFLGSSDIGHAVQTCHRWRNLIHAGGFVKFMMASFPRSTADAMWKTLPEESRLAARASILASVHLDTLHHTSAALASICLSDPSWNSLFSSLCSIIESTGNGQSKAKIAAMKLLKSIFATGISHYSAKSVPDLCKTLLALAQANEEPEVGDANVVKTAVGLLRFVPLDDPIFALKSVVSLMAKVPEARKPGLRLFGSAVTPSVYKLWMSREVADEVVSVLIASIRDGSEELAGLGISMWGGLADLENEVGADSKSVVDAFSTKVVNATLARLQTCQRDRFLDDVINSLTILMQLGISGVTDLLMQFIDANVNSLEGRTRAAALRMIGVVAESQEVIRVTNLYKARLPELLPLIHVDQESMKESVLWMIGQLAKHLPQLFTTILEEGAQLSSDIFDAIVVGLGDTSNVVTATALWAIEAACSAAPFLGFEATMARYDQWLSLSCRALQRGVPGSPSFNATNMGSNITLLDSADAIIHYMVLSCPDAKSAFAKSQLDYLIDQYDTVFQAEYREKHYKPIYNDAFVAYINAVQSVLIAYLQRFPDYIHDFANKLMYLWLASLDIAGLTEESIIFLYELLESRDWELFKPYVPQVITAFKENIHKASMTECEEAARLLADLAKVFGSEVQIDWLIPILLKKLDEQPPLSNDRCNGLLTLVRVMRWSESAMTPYVDSALALLRRETTAVTRPVTATIDGHELDNDYQLEQSFAVCLMYTALVATLDKCAKAYVVKPHLDEIVWFAKHFFEVDKREDKSHIPQLLLIEDVARTQMNIKISSLVKALCKAYGRTGPDGMDALLGADFIARAEAAAQVGNDGGEMAQQIPMLEAAIDVNGIVDGEEPNEEL